MSLSTGFEDISISTSTITIPQNGSQSYTFTPSKKYGYSVISITMDGILTSIKLNGTPLTNAQATIQSDPNKQFRHTFKVPELNNSAYTLTFYAQSNGQHVYNITIRGGVLSLIARQEKINTVIDRLWDIYNVYKQTVNGNQMLPQIPTKIDKGQKPKASTVIVSQIKNVVASLWSYPNCNTDQQTQQGKNINDESIEELRRRIDNKITVAGICYTCDQYTACTCHSSCNSERCQCNNRCHGYHSCSCNSTCNSHSCTCDEQTYIKKTYLGICECDFTTYQPNCTCNSSCDQYTSCSCNTITTCSCYEYTCRCDTACYPFT